MREGTTVRLLAWLLVVVLVGSQSLVAGAVVGGRPGVADEVEQR